MLEDVPSHHCCVEQLEHLGRHQNRQQTHSELYRPCAFLLHLLLPWQRLVKLVHLVTHYKRNRQQHNRN